MVFGFFEGSKSWDASEIPNLAGTVQFYRLPKPHYIWVLVGRVAIVTGGNSGIGLVTVRGWRFLSLTSVL